MKSGLRRLRNAAAKPPVPIGATSPFLRGHAFNLGVGRGDRESYMRQYTMSGTIFAIVSLLAESAATPRWRLYRSAPVDGRRRYTTGDYGSDQRTEVISHASIAVWNKPNPQMTGFEFREGAQLHEELTGETAWVLDMERGFPTSIWLVRPDRIDPVTGPYGELVGYVYTGPSGEQIPLDTNSVIMEKRPDPLDPYRGIGPVQAIMPNIQQQRYATEYQRNLFINGADPGGIITVPNSVTDAKFAELVDRWRESHQGVARAGAIGVLEAGTTWTSSGQSNKDLEYGNLRLANRDELREAWRIHKSMLGTADDVNRANAQTAQEVYVGWQVIPRLNRRRETLNNKLLPLFGPQGESVEFDYDDPSPDNAEAAALELMNKSKAAQSLVSAGYDPDDVCEVVGLPAMGVVERATQAPALPPAWVPEEASVTVPAARASLTLRNGKDPSGKVFEQLAGDFPPAAMEWAHYATWKGPVNVPLEHIDWTPDAMDGADPAHVQEFVKKLRAGKKLKPVILVKTPGASKLTLSDGHHRYLAAAEDGVPVRAFVATVDHDHGGWETMHDAQYGIDGRRAGATNEATLTQAQVHYRDAETPARRCDSCVMFRAPHGCTLVKGYIRADGVCDRWAPDAKVDLLRRVLSDGYVPIQVGGR